jgi:nucleoside-diphosphate-sugar epimerase
MTSDGASPKSGGTGALLVTGATGFLGTEVLRRLIERTDREIYAVIRAPGEDAADERLRDLLDTTGVNTAGRDRVVALRGDIERPFPGLKAERREELAERVTDVLHIAATVSFTLPVEQSRSTTVGGTRHALEVAELCAQRGEFGRFSYVSTAYVAGTHDGSFSEEDLDVGQGFRNAYELTKFEAERVVRDHRLYAIPARRRTPVDVVPVTFVADAIAELVQRPDDRRDTYHLVAGPHASTVGRLVSLAADYFGKRVPALVPPRVHMRLIHPLILWASPPARRQAFRKAQVFVPYFSLRLRYDNDATRRQLERRGIAVKPLEQYFDRLMSFAIRAKWGRTNVPRPAQQRTEEVAVR